MTACLICADRDAKHRYACPQCIARIQRQLRELETYAKLLEVLAEPERGTNTGSRSPGYSSKAPARDDVLTALDPRSGGGASVDLHQRRDPRDTDDNPIRSIPGSIRGIATWLREELGESQVRRSNVTSEIAYLLGKVEHCAGDQWINELADDIRELWIQARALAHDQPPGPLGACIVVGCDGTVLPVNLREPNGARHDGGRCKACQRTYTGLDLVRLQTAQEVSHG